MNGPGSGKLVVLDACCLISIAASGVAEELFAALPEAGAVAERVVAETLYVRGAAPDDPRLPRESVSIGVSDWITAGVLQVLKLGTDDDFARYVELARELDDGEAESMAIALARGYVLATDDGKARRVAAARGVPLLSTPEILKAWCERKRVSPMRAKTALTQIADRAKFRPNAKLPEADWWMRIVGK